MSLRFHEIAEADRRIQNPFSESKLRLLGEICDVSEGTRLLDLACGKGELLCAWAADRGATGTGVDISAVFLEAARDRAAELGVASRVAFERGDAADYPVANHAVDVASCVGATWIGDGLRGTLDLLDRATRDGGLLVVGEAFWTAEPSPDAVDALADGDEGRFQTLPELVSGAEREGYRLVEMVLANGDDWDRYEASQWKTVDEWVRANPDDPAADAIRDWVDENRSTYLQYGRSSLGWGVFVFRRPSSAAGV